MVPYWVMAPKLHDVLNLDCPDMPSTIQTHVVAFMDLFAQVLKKWKDILRLVGLVWYADDL